MPLQINKKVIFIVKILFTVLFFSYFFTQIHHKQNILKSITDVSFSINLKSVIICFFILSLSCLNWFTESLKWNLCLRLLTIYAPIKNIFKAVLAGLATSLLLPNRSGEFVGRIYQLIEKPHKSKQIYLSMYASLAQQLCTWLFAISALLVYIDKIKFITTYKFYLPALYIIAIVVALCYFFVHPIFQFFIRFWQGLSEFYLEVSFINKINLVFLSMFRYAIFSLQYFLALYVVGITATDPFFVFGLIAVNFLVSSYIPTFLLTEIGVRGAVSILLFQNLSSNLGGIFLASLFIWVVNIAIPAFLGWIFIIRNRKEVK